MRRPRILSALCAGTLITCALFVLAGGLSRAAAPPPSTAAAPSGARLRIGTYDTRAVALAYGRSEARGKDLADLHRQAEQAKQAKDDKRLAELKNQGERQQFLAHAQVFSNAPIGDIVRDKVGPDALAKVAADAGVVAICPSADWHDASAVEAVDVTDALVAHFSPDAKTLGFIRDIKGKPPIDLWEVHKHDDEM